MEGELKRRYPAEQRLAGADFEIETLREAGDLKRRVLVMPAPVSMLRDHHLVGADTWTFTISTVVTRFDRRQSPVLFTFTSRTYRRAMAARPLAGWVVLVARMRGMGDFVDDLGHVRRVPIFVVDELTDQGGTWKREVTH